MFLKKIQYRISKVVNGVLNRTRNIEINWGYWAFTFVCLLSIILLGANIFRIIKKGYERYEIIQDEKRRLEKLIAKNEELTEELKYYSSTEYVDIKAREELNLAFPNQRLVYIEKEDEILIDSETTRDDTKLDPNWRLWYDLIF
jgi:cell division protein FtsB